MKRIWILSAAIAAVLLVSPAAAQGVFDAPSVAPSAAPSALAQVVTPVAAPTLGSVQAAAPVGVRAITPAVPLVPAPAPRVYGRNPALMIVGGAMLLVGAVIGGDAGTIVMIGGGGLGLLGLWQYLS